MFKRHRDDTETLYRRGVAAWVERDLSQAIASMEAALAASPDPDQDGWWFSASRALAQVAMEQGDMGAAERHLRRLPRDAVGLAQQLALRGRLDLLEGREESAALQVGHAITTLELEAATDVGTLMNGAIALMWCGEVLRELGFGEAAIQVTVMARGRTAQAGVDDAVIRAGLDMVAAGGARLMALFDGALGTLDRLDTALSPELEIEANRERARIAWVLGDLDTARRLYGDAESASHSKKYPALARMIGEESVNGPRRARSETFEAFLARVVSGSTDVTRPYAIVARFSVGRPLDDYFAMEAGVAGLLASKPHLGYVDGNGTDGEVWELFLEGDDPDALWAAVGPLVTRLADSGTRVEIRRGEGVETLDLA